jgi:hypothetical protein
MRREPPLIVSYRKSGLSFVHFLTCKKRALHTGDSVWVS